MENNEEKSGEIVLTEEKEQRARERYEAVQKTLAEIREKAKEAGEVMSQGKGKLELETKLSSGGKEIDVLEYDFTALTGMEYTDAMDSDGNANAQAYGKITYRQALALFAKSAAKHTEGVDMEDIVSRLGATDAVEAVQLATVFFTQSSRAGRMRISKR